MASFDCECATLHSKFMCACFGDWLLLQLSIKILLDCKFTRFNAVDTEYEFLESPCGPERKGWDFLAASTSNINGQHALSALIKDLNHWNGVLLQS